MMLFCWLYKIIAVAIGIASFIFGIIALMRPDSVIKSQQRFCERINWKVEPISWDIEIKSTKRFGRILILLSIGILALVILAA